MKPTSTTKQTKRRTIQLKWLVVVLVVSTLVATTWWLYTHHKNLAFIEAQSKIATQLKFDAYLPEYVPKGYRLIHSEVNKNRDPNQPDVTIKYQSEGSTLTLYEYDVVATNVGYKDCGPITPSIEATPGCRLVAATNRSIGIYQDGVENGEHHHDFLTLGSVRLVLAPAPSNVEAEKMYSSMRKTAPAKLPFKR